MLPLYAVYGVSGFGREVLPMARAQAAEMGLAPDRLVFVDDGADVAVVNGYRVLGFEAFLHTPASDRFAVLAIADATVRQRLAARLADAGVRPWQVRAAQSVVMDDVALGEGAILCPFVTLTSNIRIGQHFHANLYSYVAHDCVIGDFVTSMGGYYAVLFTAMAMVFVAGMILESLPVTIILAINTKLYAGFG